jgi:hypothetical protein
LALCQQGKVPQQAGEFAEQAGALAERTLATSLVATSFVAPALAEKKNFDLDRQNALPPSPAPPEIRKRKVASRANIQRGPRRPQQQYHVGPATGIERTIDHEWRRLIKARRSVHSTFARLIRDARPPQSKQNHRKQRRSD